MVSSGKSGERPGGENETGLRRSGETMLNQVMQHVMSVQQVPSGLDISNDQEM